MAALDGQLKHEDTNLASSTLIPDQTTKENLGIIVQYKVRPEKTSPHHGLERGERSTHFVLLFSKVMTAS
jgi:hypothetical protein